MSSSVSTQLLPELPLLLWDTPPGLALILGQEGVPFEEVGDPHPFAFQRGRFVLFDGRRLERRRLREVLSDQHIPIDIDQFRQQEWMDPFLALIDNRAALSSWRIGAYNLTERVARRDKAAIRQRILGRLRETVATAGGLWARLSAFPHPYRSAFNFRVDLDEPYPDDYFRFAWSRRSLECCTTHFVSTHAYGQDAAVLHDLRRHDTQSHGHFHVVYREAEANRRNLERAQAALAHWGIVPTGFAAPEGRWNEGLDDALEQLSYVYASDFGVGYDDFPFFPWRGERFSKVLQVPVHPICEGLFLDAGATDGGPIAAHLIRVLRHKIAAGEPAFLYGHPERRLARVPEVLAALREEIERYDLLWRVSLTEFARWWRWRSRRRWSVLARGLGRFEIQFEDWNPSYPLAVEIVRGTHAASVPIQGPRTPLGLEGMSYERRSSRFDLPGSSIVRRPFHWKTAVRSMLDWETVTPWEELPVDSFRARLKKHLRRWRERGSTPRQARDRS